MTGGKQSTKNFLRHYSMRQSSSSGSNGELHNDEGSNGMIGRSAEDESEYSSRAEEIEAWLQMYGKQYVGSGDDYGSADDNQQCQSYGNEYDFHPIQWRYVILDDRPSAAKPNTPLFDRFVLTQTKEGLTEDDAVKVIDLLLHGPEKR